MNNRLHILFWFFLRRSVAVLIGICLWAGLSVSARAKGTPPAQAPAVLTVSVSSATICAGTRTDLTASGCPTGGALRWASGQTGATITVAPQQTTTYTAICEVTSTSVTTTTATSGTATSTTGVVTTVTTTTATGTVQVYPAIVLSPTVSSSVLCKGGKEGQITINATGGSGALQYQFNGQPFQSSNKVFGNLQAGVYSVGAKDGVGCTVQANVEVREPPSLSVSIGPVSPKCVGGSDGAFFAVASGGVGDYRYILDYGTPQTSGVFLNLKAATPYTLAVTDKNNCILFQTVTIDSPVPFDIKLATKSARCAGSADGSVTATVTGGTGPYQYQIGTSPFQTGTQFTGLAANSYEITIQDNNGCQGKKTAVVDQPAPLQVKAVPGPVNCFGPNSGSITLTPTGGTGAVQYQLATGKAPQASNVFTGIPVGNYTVVGTDANGCTSVVSVTVGQSDPLKIQAASIAATCCICPTGAVKLSSTGGTGTGRQYQLVGQPYQANSQINGLRPNTYRFRIVDEVGCTDSIAAVVTDGNALTLAAGKIKDVSCAGGNDGEAAVQVAGGTKPFIYYWASERRDTLTARTASQTGLIEGTYTVSVLDSNRCTTSTIFVPIKAQYPVPYKPTISQIGSSTLTVDQSAGIQWYVRTGTNPGQPVPNATNPTLVPFASGQYYVIITANGCSSPPSDAINFILTALAEPVSGLSVKIVPNPVVDRLRVEIEQTERAAVVVQMLDASGRTVMTKQIPAFTGKKQAEWPLAGISTGTYLLNVSADTRQSVLRVLVE
jgi:hypothetical protein